MRLIHRAAVLALLLIASVGRPEDLAANLPYYFSVPETAFAPSENFRLSSFKFEPVKAKGFEQSPVGLRIVRVKRGGEAAPVISKRLVDEGILRDGDVILTFRPEWAGSTAYQQILLGASHTGLILTEDGIAYNVDIPLDEKFVGPDLKSALDSEHYREARALHVLRPRKFGDANVENLRAWIALLRANLPAIRERGLLKFSILYLDPKYGRDPEMDFLYNFATILKGEASDERAMNLFCSEFVWTLLSMASCRPEQVAPGWDCGEKIIEPMDVFSPDIYAPIAERKAGYAEGPLMILDALGIEPTRRRELIDAIFTEKPIDGEASYGHRLAAARVEKLIQVLKPYYQAYADGRKEFEVVGPDGGLPTTHAKLAEDVRALFKPNYPPAAFLINSFLPADHPDRNFDYVCTIEFN